MITDIYYLGSKMETILSSSFANIRLWRIHLDQPTVDLGCVAQSTEGAPRVFTLWVNIPSALREDPESPHFNYKMLIFMIVL